MKKEELHGSQGQVIPHEPIAESAKSGIRRALTEILRSGPFRTSRQCQDLLRYVVEQSITEEGESLRERIIGVEVFGRRPDYDTAEDPVVRIRAADVRKRLALYYQSTNDPGPVRFDIPHGSYRARFEWTPERYPDAADPPLALSAEPAQLEPVAEAPKSLLKKLPLLPVAFVCACLVALVALSFFWLWHTADERALDRFWSPVLSSSVPPLIYVGSNAVYSLSPSFVWNYRQQHNLTTDENMGREFFIPLLPGEKLDADDFVAVKDTYVTIGDVAASTSITALLARRGKAYEMRYGGDVVFGDLQQSPTVLIGAFNNSWTLEMTNNLRYIFTYDHRIVDRMDKGRTWASPEGSTEDYAIVSRILNSKTGQVLLTVAGIGQAGTRAAGVFLTDPKAIASFLKTASKGWQKENLQIVLHTPLVNGVPSGPDVVAAYYW